MHTAPWRRAHQILVPSTEKLRNRMEMEIQDQTSNAVACKKKVALCCCTPTFAMPRIVKQKIPDELIRRKTFQASTMYLL